ncbi:hypothetical protein C5Q96_07975 [Mogibacterium diversum]|uniref:NTP pyrophosphohydrolase MazG putative catalytic core domain-containing protein n=1 Tax=Mogibacterium diversum TaxID=114527 RepID=A0A2S0L677_9FIRM|nr:MazG-like family protein [Mogibacterium diversum]AVM48795.1 hypothetical protein C5Q96_07975 [Mogibacterium diversum]
MIAEIWEHYGEKLQIKQTIEELSELITALTWGNKEDITEEIGDVEIMIAQLKGGLNINTAEVIQYKLKRQMRRIIEEADGRNPNES